MPRRKRKKTVKGKKKRNILFSFKLTKTGRAVQKHFPLVALTLVAAFILLTGRASHSPVFRNLFSPSKPAEKPKIAFVIDDIGYKNDQTSALRRLGGDITYAVLPLLKYSRFHGNLSRETGAEVILHLPLEADDHTLPGKGIITSEMPRQHILERLNGDLASIPNVIGVNNHMGSAGTSNDFLMDVILSELKRRGLFFLDSKTTAQSKALKVAGYVGLPLLERDVFLDNQDDDGAIREQIQILASTARQKGYAIGIGHYRKKTFKILLEEIPKLKQENFEIVSLRDLLGVKRKK